MTQKIDAVIAVAGWEERFLEGLKVDLETFMPKELFILTFGEYADKTNMSRSALMDLAGQKGIKSNELIVQRQPVQLWRAIREKFSGTGWAHRSVLVDITTMPREVIWWVFSALRSSGSHISYVYHKPGSYSPEWLTRDTDRPRLIYQHSGIAELGRETCLFLVSGFDVDRAIQIMQFFEPRTLIIGLQSGSQFENAVRNVAHNRRLLERVQNPHFVELDSYSPDHGLAAMEAALKSHFGQFNVVAASLGPKLSAVSLSHWQIKHPDIALAYAPSRQFNYEYSRGIGENPITCVLDTL
ncbi:MAG TPA: hypothetical protein VGJ30_12995 [Candidatus Angelobacter sp.]